MASSQNFEQHQLSATQLRDLTRKYWRVVLIVFIAGTLTMYGSLAVFFTELYVTEVPLLVKVGRETMETPSTVQRGQVLGQGVRLADINSEVQILSSRSLVEAVVDRLGPDVFKSVLAPPEHWYGYPKFWAKWTARQVKQGYKEFLILVALDKRLGPREAAILDASAGVKVEPIKDSDILVLKVTMPAPKLCVDFANTLLEVYLQRRIAIRRMPAGSEFFKSRMEEARARLQSMQRVRAEVRAKWNLIAPEEQRSLYLQRLSTLDVELQQSEAEIAKLKVQGQLMHQQSAAMPDSVLKEQVDGSNPAIQSIKDRIGALRVERAKTASRYQAGSEVVAKIDAEIRDLQAALNQESATILNSVTTENNPTKRELTSGVAQQAVQVAGLESRRDVLTGPATALKERLQQIDRGMDEMESAEREYRRAEQDYQIYAKLIEEARMSEQLDSERVTNVAVVASPDTPLKPVYPNKLFLMGIAMPTSLVLGIALAALLDTIEDRVLDEGSVLAFQDLTYLGTVEVADEA